MITEWLAVLCFLFDDTVPFRNQPEELRVHRTFSLTFGLSGSTLGFNILRTALLAQQVLDAKQ